MDIHGTADPLVPYGGGTMTGRGGQSQILAATALFDRWRGWDGCGGATAQRDLPQRVEDGTSVQVTVAGGCPAGVVVELWTVAGGGHTWPGGQQYLPKRLIGPVSHQFDAPPTIWQFFTAHSRP
jgi:polyhydroxybutyrate depolymerase